MQRGARSAPSVPITRMIGSLCPEHRQARFKGRCLINDTVWSVLATCTFSRVRIKEVQMFVNYILYNVPVVNGVVG